MKILNIEVPDDKVVSINHLKSIEVIFSEFYKLCLEINQKQQNCYLVKSDVDSFFQRNLLPRSSNPANPLPKASLDLLSSLSLLKTIRLYQAGLNTSFKTLEVQELPNDILRQTLCLNELKLWNTENFSRVPSEVICFYLPHNYQFNCLSIFESSFALNTHYWALKGISLLRDNISSCVVRRQKVWVLETLNKTVNNFNNLKSAVQAAAEMGFIPAAFWYFHESIQMPPETISNDVINLLNLLRVQFKEKKNFKSRCFRDLKKVIVEQARNYRINYWNTQASRKTQIYISDLAKGQNSAKSSQNSKQQEPNFMSSSAGKINSNASAESKPYSGYNPGVPKIPSTENNPYSGYNPGVPKMPSTENNPYSGYNPGVPKMPSTENKPYSKYNPEVPKMPSTEYQKNPFNRADIPKVQSPVKGEYQVAEDPFSIPYIDPYASVEKQFNQMNPEPFPKNENQLKPTPAKQQNDSLKEPDREYSIRIKRGTVNQSLLINDKKNEVMLESITETEEIQQVTSSWNCDFCWKEIGYHLPLCEHYIHCQCGGINYSSSTECYFCHSQIRG